VPTSDRKSKFHYTLGRYSRNPDVTGLPDIQLVVGAKCSSIMTIGLAAAASRVAAMLVE